MLNLRLFWTISKEEAPVDLSILLVVAVAKLQVQARLASSEAAGACVL